MSATMAMTIGMRLLFKGLAGQERYPLPPRELTEGILPAPKKALPALTLLAHFGYGAVAGALFTWLPHSLRNGPVYGAAVWAVSYLGWIPASKVLHPATRHPMRRNLLMIAVHLIWGLALSQGLHELDRSAQDIFEDGPQPDRRRAPLA
ncbi:MAG: DUF1440 domain-containing protein [Mesorhizobium sp.]|nr:DUF1440 domain-containing protein [Mesorhizobium sp.]